MTQYVLQINDVTQKLEKSYEVTVDDPIRTVVPADRTQIVITDTAKFNKIVDIYTVNTTNAKFSWDGTNITWDIV